METKTKQIIKAVNQDIETHVNAAREAMAVMENMKSSAEEYQKALFRFSESNFIAGYLRHFADIIENGDEKSAENLIRFHAHYQRNKGRGISSVSVAFSQDAVVRILDGYVEQFFSAAS